MKKEQFKICWMGAFKLVTEEEWLNNLIKNNPDYTLFSVGYCPEPVEYSFYAVLKINEK